MFTLVLYSNQTTQTPHKTARLSEFAITCAVACGLRVVVISDSTSQHPHLLQVTPHLCGVRSISQIRFQQKYYFIAFRSSTSSAIGVILHWAMKLYFKFARHEAREKEVSLASKESVLPYKILHLII